MSENQGSASTKEQIKAAVVRLTEGMGFQVEELVNEMVISNPHDLDTGRLHVDFEHGYLSWERVVWEYFGTVAPGLGEEDTKTVSRETIVGLLGG